MVYTLCFPIRELFSFFFIGSFRMSTGSYASPRRFHIEGIRIGTIALSGDQAHHALHVLRLGIGDTVTVFDGAGQSARAKIASVGRNEVELAVDQEPVLAERAGPLIELAFAIPRGKRVDWLVEKATELGVGVLQPIGFTRSVVRGDGRAGGKQDRWLGHCISAARQCELDFLPELRPIQPLEEYLGGCSTDIKLMGEVSPDASTLFDAVSSWRPGGSIGLLIGPEGDLTGEERSQCHQNGFRPIHFGHTILRVETAAIALAAGVVAACDHLA
jgi:16S rRNA (uracil1498-N3)-methyltransferase